MTLMDTQRAGDPTPATGPDGRSGRRADGWAARLADRATGLAGRRLKFVTLLLWLAVAAVAGPLAVQLSDAVDNSEIDALPASAEANRAEQRIRAAFPTSDALVAVVAYARGTGLTDADRAKVEADRAGFARYAEGGAVPPAAPSGDGQAALLSFPLAGDDEAQSAAVDQIKDRMASGVPPGLRTALTGSAGAEDDVFDAFSGMSGTLLAATALTVALLLLVTYRSPVLWLVPLLAVGIADQVAGAAAYLLTKHGVIDINFQSQSIMTVLVFGVGVDYALLLIARYREELRRHADRHEAMRLALRRSFPAIFASAATVAIGLLCLLAATLPATHGLGPVCAIGVLATMLTMTALLPAILVLCGRWLFWPFVPRYDPERTDADVAADHGLWGRLAGVVARRPGPVWIGSLAALALLGLGIGRLSVGLPDDQSFTREVGSVTGQRLIGAHYPGGTTEPASIVAAAGAADAVVAAARPVAGVAEVGTPERSADGRWVRVPAVLDAASDSDAAKRTVERLRDAVRAVPGGQALVGGDTASALDTDGAVSRDNRVVIPLILLVVFGILVLLLRALVAPVLLLASVVVSYLAALGTAGLILGALGYPHLWNGLPLQTFLFLVALGVDYTIFLMSRAREEVGRFGHATGVRRALTITGGVITSAGVVLAATFGALIVLPLVPTVQTGVIVAAGVLLDTFLVRTLLVPALALHVGRRTWWPGRLPAR